MPLEVVVGGFELRLVGFIDLWVICGGRSVVVTAGSGCCPPFRRKSHEPRRSRLLFTPMKVEGVSFSQSMYLKNYYLW